MEALAAIALLIGLDFPSHGYSEGLTPVDTLLQEEFTLGSFQAASNVVVNPQGWMYVVESEENRVWLLTGPKEQPRSVGGFGWGSTSFDKPSGLATDGLTVFVSDRNNHRIQRFDRSLNYLSSFSTRDTNVLRARIGFPAGVALSRQGDLFVLDGENVRVVKFTARLELERSFGGLEDKLGRLRHPIKILVTRDDRVYVLEQNRIVEFDYFGNVVRTIGDGTLHNARGFDANPSSIVVATDDSLFWFSASGRQKSKMPVTAIVSSVRLVPLRDVVLLNDRILLLSANSLTVFRILAAR